MSNAAVMRATFEWQYSVNSHPFLMLW